ncbi:MAG: DNA translocase FtsK [Candidatus Hydrogenedentota bacterium]
MAFVTLGVSSDSSWGEIMGSPPKISVERVREIVGVLFIAFTIFLFLALVSDGYEGNIRRPLDGVSQTGHPLGWPGSWVAWFLTLLLGYGAHVIYCITCVWGLMLLRHTPLDRVISRVGGLFLLSCSVAALLHIHMTAAGEGVGGGGTIGAFFGDLTRSHFGVIGATVVALTLSSIGLLLSTDFLFVRALNALRLTVMLMMGLVVKWMQALAHNWQERRNTRKSASETPRRTEKAWGVVGSRKKAETQPEAPDNDPEPAERRIHIRSGMRETQADNVPVPETQELPFEDVPGVDDGPLSEEGAGEKKVEEEFEEEDAYADSREAEETRPSRSKPVLPRRKQPPEDEIPPDYVYPKRYAKPSLDLFDPPPPAVEPDLEDHLYATSALLEDTLKTFGIEAQVVEVTRGPTITRFELEPAPGIKVSRFHALADDIALALKAYRVRVEAPIPGKGRVGIEVPNHDRETVVVRELLESRSFSRSDHALPLALGKGIGGEVHVVDLATMPHMLVAGATGAGKTVCVKTLLASLLMEKTPADLQLMLIDPKMVELSIFNDIPHLITPVVTDAKKAASGLNWLINEMEERYRLFAHLRTRNIEVYNASVENGEIEMPDKDGEAGESMDIIRKLPYVVCVIDELADLMMLARAEVEDAIARLAQLARAVGIHLVIATQRPSVDVLTGVIKANFPARISFQVSSRVDSRCILDEIGAERLIGKGDMLYLPPGRSKPTRIQSAFVSDEEMNRLVAYLKTQAPPQYREEIERFGKAADNFDDLTDQDDELFDEAVRIVLETGQASISMVQRRLRVGYTRAARLIDMMELRGIVGPHIGSKAREILVDSPPKNEVA